MKLISSILAMTVCATAAWGADLEGFQTSYAAAEKLAKEQGKPMYLHFTTTWCGWCRKIEKDDYANPAGKKALQDFVPATLDCTVAENGKPSKEVEFNMKLMGKYGGQGYPFIVMLAPDGTLLGTIGGYVPLEEFVKELGKTQQTYNEYQEFQAYAKKADKKGYEYNLKALKLFTKAQNSEAAAAAAKMVLQLDPKNEKGDAGEAQLALLHAAWAKEDKPAAQSALDAIKKLDPDNEKGLLEKAMFGQAQRILGEAKTPQEFTVKMGLAIAVLEDLTAKAKKLKEGQDIYGTLGMVYARQGKSQPAVAALEKAIAANPASPDVEQIKKIIEQIKAAGAKGDTTTQPANDEK